MWYLDTLAHWPTIWWAIGVDGGRCAWIWLMTEGNLVWRCTCGKCIGSAMLWQLGIITHRSIHLQVISVDVSGCGLEYTGPWMNPQYACTCHKNSQLAKCSQLLTVWSTAPTQTMFLEKVQNEQFNELAFPLLSLFVTYTIPVLCIFYFPQCNHTSSPYPYLTCITFRHGIEK